jgi:TPR repeat protein
MYRIGELYFYGGYGIQKDLKLAKEWCQKAADLGNENAKKVLANW